MSTRTILLGLLILVVLYGGWKAFPLLRGPSLTIESPAPYASLPDGYVVIRGTARHTNSLTLNNGPLLIDENGRFSKVLLLPPGGAILTLTAADRFGRQVTRERTVYIP
jgi:hypothetical protein